MSNPPPQPANLTPFRTRIGVAAFKITEKVNTQTRQPIDTLLARFSPSLAESLDSFFPITLRRHATNSDRTTSQAWESVLYFHIANAAYTFYQAVLGSPVLDQLQARVTLIEDIASRGPSKFHVAGNDGTGFHLVQFSEKPVPFLKPGGVNTEGDTDIEKGEAD